MRRVITAISFMLFGASMLIFISVLLIPLLRESTSWGGNSKIDVYEWPASLKKSIEKLALKQTQSPKPIDPMVAEEKGSPPPEPIDPIDAQEKDSSPREPMSLIVLGDGSFSPGEVRPKAGVQQAIDKIIPLINARPLDSVLVEGHADKAIPDGFNRVQASKWNKIVSMQRAKAVARILKQKGVADDRIIVNGLGDAVPLASNRTREGRSKNRRVEIKLSAAR